MMDFMVVVLPAPLRPRRVTTSPLRTSKFIPCRMWDSPYQECRSLTASSTPSAPLPLSIAGPHIRLDHFRILRHRLVIAFGQNLAAAQNGNGVRQFGDDTQIVLDHQDGAV